jgi:hypothetical protein
MNKFIFAFAAAGLLSTAALAESDVAQVQVTPAVGAHSYAAPQITYDSEVGAPFSKNLQANGARVAAPQLGDASAQPSSFPVTSRE